MASAIDSMVDVLPVIVVGGLAMKMTEGMFNQQQKTPVPSGVLRSRGKVKTSRLGNSYSAEVPNVVLGQLISDLPKGTSYKVTQCPSDREFYSLVTVNQKDGKKLASLVRHYRDKEWLGEKE